MSTPSDVLCGATAQAAFRRYGVRAAWLFGSHARGDATVASDVDVAVLFPPSLPPLRRLQESAALETELRGLLQHEIDLVTLNAAGAALAFEAVVRGVTVFAADPEDAFRYEGSVRRRYEDFQHIQGIFTHALRDRLGVP